MLSTYTEATSQRNTDFGVHFLFFYLSILFFWGITLFDNNKSLSAPKIFYLPRTDEQGPFIRKQELHVEFVAFIW